MSEEAVRQAVSVAGQVATVAWENRDEARTWLDRLRAWWRGSANVLIVGAGGVGKSTLARHLAGEYDLLVRPPGGRYAESVDVETVRADLETLRSGTGRQMQCVVLPGQRERRPATWSAPLNALTRGDFVGVVHVVAYGYHDLQRLPIEDHPLYVRGAGGRDVFPATYAESCRQEEIEVLREIARRVEVAANRMWFLTLIVKQDLWWPERAEVEQHYRSGPYGQEIIRLLAARRSEPLMHEFHSASLVISQFKDPEGSIVRRNAAGYDHAEYVRGLRRTLEVLEVLCRWGDKP